MRYIDEMLKGIPLEEMTGGTDMDRNESIRAVIPDNPAPEPVKAEESYVKNEHESIAYTPGSDEPEVKPSGKPVRVKRGGLGALAAVLALVITTGGVLTYLGAAKHIGPMAQVFNSSEQQPESLPSNDDEKTVANARAKLVFTTTHGVCADMLTNGKISEVPKGQFTVDLDDIDGTSEGIPEYMVKYLKSLNDAPIFGGAGGEISFFIDAHLKPLCAQWHSKSGGYVGQYPDPADGLTFGEMPEYVTESLTNVTGWCTRHTKLFTGEWYAKKGRGSYDFTEEQFNELKEAIADREHIDVAGSAELFGNINGIEIEMDGETISVEYSDFAGAPLKINDEYCRCDKAERFLESILDDYWAESASKLNIYNFTEYWGTNGLIPEEDLSVLRKWYEGFLAAGYQPVSDVGTEIDQPYMRELYFKFNGTAVNICSTKYSNANIQINGQYYNVTDTSVFDYTDKLELLTESQNKELTEDIEKAQQAEQQ